VSWIERTAQGPRLQIRRYGANGVAAAPIDVSKTAGVRSGGFPKMVVTGNELILAWTDTAEPSHIRSAVLNY
jgi:hypothetical protein